MNRHARDDNLADLDGLIEEIVVDAYYDTEQRQAAALLREWTEEQGSVPATGSDPDATPTKLIYPLEHAYTQSELGFSALKGADTDVAEVMVGAAHQAGCDLYLALVSIAESGWAEYAGAGSTMAGQQLPAGGSPPAGSTLARLLTAIISRNVSARPAACADLLARCATASLAPAALMRPAAVAPLQSLPDDNPSTPAGRCQPAAPGANQRDGRRRAERL